MYFRFYLLNDESNPTIARFVNALVKSAQLNVKELNNFLLSCFDRNIDLDFIELSLEMLKHYVQSLTTQLEKIHQARTTANAFIELSQDEAMEDEALREKLIEIQARTFALIKKTDEINVTVLVINELIQKIEAKREVRKSSNSNIITNKYFDLSYEEYLFYERYKGRSIDFHHFFGAFIAQGQNHLKPPKERLESLLKYQYEDPQCDDVFVVLVDDESPAFLPQFQSLSVEPQGTSVSTSSCSTMQEVIPSLASRTTHR
ncbi:MAG: hypothetical protein HYX61_06925 [Gammaproteobacteria bacterium]|jgi:hypothetical protein|nr:hypothetical protein [Gammaproteobacteria bacterium]